MQNDAFRAEINAAGNVATFHLTRPETGNKLRADEIRALGQAISEYGGREGVKAVLVRAGGESFCLGRLPDAATPAPRTALGIRTDVTEPILDLYAAIRNTPVPVIALVQGAARGFGCALVGQCDLVIAADHASFAMPEMDHDLPPTLAISAVLGKIPPKRLMHMVYTRESIAAPEALALGLISEIAPAAELDAAAARTLARLVERSKPALCAVKEYMAAAPYMDPAAAARLAANILSVVLASRTA